MSRFVRSVYRSEGGRRADLNIVFVDDRTMLRLNGRFLRHHHQTDVLSFPLADHPSRPEGEIYVNLDQARRQAHRFNETIRSEVARLVAHGVLHLRGYQDRSAAGRREMRAREEYHLKRVRIKR